MSASLTSFISPSTIRMLSIVAPTMMSMSARVFSLKVGLITSLPSIRATRTSEIGPPKGMSDTARAAEAASPASASGWMSRSAEMRFTVTNTSAWKSDGKRGRRARSMSRATRISLSDGRPSRLRKPPGKRPAAAYFSLYSTERGMKSVSGLASLAATTVASSMVSPCFTTTAPSACLASFPVEMVISRPSPIGMTFTVSLYNIIFYPSKSVFSP